MSNTKGNNSTEAEAIQNLLDAGWIKLEGNHYVKTVAGAAALRRGFPGKTYGESLPVDSVRARTKQPIRKKKHRHG